MTVIAVFEDLQLALADNLLSVNDPTIHTWLPTVGNTAQIPGANMGFSRLVRKVISAKGPAGSAQVLAAGTVTHIAYFADILSRVFRNQIDLPDHLKDLVRHDGSYGCVRAAALLADAAGYREFEFVGATNSGICKHTFDATEIAADIPYFGKVWIAGSGAINLRGWLENRGEYYAKIFHHNDADERRLRVASTLPLLLLNEDIAPAPRTLLTGVGGYYEIFEILPGALAPIGDCMTVIGDIGRNRDQSLTLRRLLYHCYRDDFMYVFSMMKEPTLIAGKTTRIALSDCEVLLVEPLQTRETPTPWDKRRIVTAMCGAEIVRYVLRKNVENSPVVNRLASNSREHQLLDISLSGENLAITLVESSLTHFSAKFPERLADCLKVP